uniref:Secreted protein n=1 Tax=Caenorhabditis tropicalis TaxID=1561998 RepID=A0A1I7U594_9PELO
MFTFPKLLAFFLFFSFNSMFNAEEELMYQKFVTVATTQERGYLTLGSVASISKKLLSFDAKNASADYSSPTWMNDCYRDFYAANNSKGYVVFWLKGDILYCETVFRTVQQVKPTFEVQYLMRMEQPGDRCAV